ncbi:hypothetical protein KAU11_02425, partial [Candidatus Babeliales bacterium]|nr:hypothetical protein [Candidatus Babeliales bacterium]
SKTVFGRALKKTFKVAKKTYKTAKRFLIKGIRKVTKGLKRFLKRIVKPNAPGFVGIENDNFKKSKSIGTKTKKKNIIKSHHNRVRNVDGKIVAGSFKIDDVKLRDDNKSFRRLLKS